MFIIQTFGSIGAELIVSRLAGTSTPGDLMPTTRFDQARQELRNAVQALPADARFGVVTFLDGVRRRGKPLVLANDQRRSSLRELLKGMNAESLTNLYGALDEALDLKGTRRGQELGAGIDEISVLCDDQPSSLELTDTDAILAAMRAANRVRRGRIHTVALGGSSEFVRLLAEEHGGPCVKR